MKVADGVKTCLNHSVSAEKSRDIKKHASRKRGRGRNVWGQKRNDNRVSHQQIFSEWGREIIWLLGNLSWQADGKYAPENKMRMSDCDRLWHVSVLVPVKLCEQPETTCKIKKTRVCVLKLRTVSFLDLTRLLCTRGQRSELTCRAAPCSSYVTLLRAAVCRRTWVWPPSSC